MQSAPTKLVGRAAEILYALHEWQRGVLENLYEVQFLVDLTDEQMAHLYEIEGQQEEVSEPELIRRVMKIINP